MYSRTDIGDEFIDLMKKLTRLDARLVGAEHTLKWAAAIKRNHTPFSHVPETDRRGLSCDEDVKEAEERVTALKEELQQVLTQFSEYQSHYQTFTLDQQKQVLLDYYLSKNFDLSQRAPEPTAHEKSLFKICNPAILDDAIFIARLHKLNPWLFQFASKRLKYDPEFVISLLMQHPSYHCIVTDIASSRFKDDENFMLRAFRLSCDSYMSSSVRIKSNPENLIIKEMLKAPVGSDEFSVYMQLLDCVPEMNGDNPLRDHKGMGATRKRL
jgi:hypothetical protein